MNIREWVSVKPRPTVVRLDHLKDPDPTWITENYYITEEVEGHLKVLRYLLNQPHGSGLFLVGHYGSGKSHFLAYLAQRLKERDFVPKPVGVTPVSLLNYHADQSLEAILEEALDLRAESRDRRVTWSALNDRFPEGCLLVLDELSEFLRSKGSINHFNEDIRFLQFLGEWAQDQPLWIIAALQEKIEHTGEMEYDLFRKIKDRYPYRLVLSPTHVRDLIGGNILRKKEGYDEAVGKLLKQLRRAFPQNEMDAATFAQIYPLHPATLDLLEEVRDRFSQARGIVGFTLQQFNGDEARGVEPFLDKPWGSLLSPETIVDHFRDLFEVQPEFLPLAQKLFPYYRKNTSLLFPKEAQVRLAERLIKLLVLVYLSPVREGLTATEASLWLLYKVSTIQPEKNVQIVARVLDKLCKQGAYIKKSGEAYRIDLQEDQRDTLDQLLARNLIPLEELTPTMMEDLVPLLKGADFNPFRLDRDRWQIHKLRWYFHEWDFRVYFGEAAPALKKGLGLRIGLPWGRPSGKEPAGGTSPGDSLSQGGNYFSLIPETLEMTEEIKELLVLVRLREGPLPRGLVNQIEDRIRVRTGLFAAQIRKAYQGASLVDPFGQALPPLREPPQKDVRDWLWKFGEVLLRRTYPQFETYAPSHGPLPREAYVRFAAYSLSGDLEEAEVPDYVALIREAYLVPMKLMERKGRSYRVSSKLDRHDLVLSLKPQLQHQVSPKRIYEQLAMPVYGLVPDQIHLLLLFLMIQGEIEILKGRNSYRDLYESFPLPNQYDRLKTGKALGLNQLHEFQILCQGLQIPMLDQPNVLAQRRCARQLQKVGRQERDQFSAFIQKLTESGEAGDLIAKLEHHLEQWAALEKGENELQGLQHFLFGIGSARRFVAAQAELAALPQKLDRLMAETGRLRHLMLHPALRECADSKIALAVEHLGEPPGLAEGDALEVWQEAAKTLYFGYQKWYRERHDQWWRELRRRPIWEYRLPAVLASRHLGLVRTRENFTQTEQRARQLICRGLGNLQFQPQCPCGFDGHSATVAEQLNILERLRDEIEEGLAQFFQQNQVREKVATWVESGLETTPPILAYLADEKPYPEFSQIDLMDQHLAGLQLFREIDTAKVLDLLHERHWDRDQLVSAFARLVQPFGERLVFKKSRETPPREGLLSWCAQMALNTATALPKGFSLDEIRRLAELVKPQWVTHEALQNLTELGLGREAENRIYAMALGGEINLPEARATRGMIAALQTLSSLPEVGHAGDLAQWSSLLYQQHQRMLHLAGEPWLLRLEQLARKRLSDPPPPLLSLLAQNLDHQWLLIDCLGLPLLDLVCEFLERWLPHWRLDRIDFALVSHRTDTASFYDGLADQGINKRFAKTNVVDRLIHESKGNFNDLRRLTQSELEISLRKQKDLDPALPLLIFADHGFRLNPDGRGFSHGGDSNLERCVPLIRLTPFV